MDAQAPVSRGAPGAGWGTGRAAGPPGRYLSAVHVLPGRSVSRRRAGRACGQTPVASCLTALGTHRGRSPGLRTAPFVSAMGRPSHRPRARTARAGPAPSRSTVQRILTRHGLVDQQEQNHRRAYRRWQGWSQERDGEREAAGVHPRPASSTGRAAEADGDTRSLPTRRPGTAAPAAIAEMSGAAPGHDVQLLCRAAAEPSSFSTISRIVQF